MLATPVFALGLKDFFFRADNLRIKLTFKFDAPCTWEDVSPDSQHIVLDVPGATRILPYEERSMNVGPVQRISFREEEGALRIGIELKSPVSYEVYDEAGGRLVSVILKGPFAIEGKKGEGGEELLSFEFYEADIRDVLLALARARGVNIVVDDSVQGTITFSFENLTFDQALGYILKMRGLGYIRMANNIIVAEKGKLEENFGLLDIRRFPLKNISPDKAKEIVSLVIPPERIATDSAGRALVVRGREEEFQKVEEILKKTDITLETKTFYLSNNIYEKDEQLAKFRELLKIVIPEEERVNYDFTQKAFVVRGTKEEMEAVGQLISNLDRKLPQIMVDAKFVEVNREKVKDLGVKWTVGGKEGGITFGELSLGGTLERQSLVEMTIKALETKNLARLVGNPRILTLSGKKAEIKVTDKIPYIEARSTVDEKGQVQYTYGVSEKEVGVTLTVTPVLTADGEVLVHVVPSVSTGKVVEIKAEGLSWSVPQTSEKKADTTARLRPGETLVIGGLIRSEDIENITRIPILSEIPILGELFTLRSRTHKETELIVFLTPYVVEY